jgi:hypothetical protein
MYHAAARRVIGRLEKFPAPGMAPEIVRRAGRRPSTRRRNSSEWFLHFSDLRDGGNSAKKYSHWL